MICHYLIFLDPEFAWSILCKLGLAECEHSSCKVIVTNKLHRILQESNSTWGPLSICCSYIFSRFSQSFTWPNISLSPVSGISGSSVIRLLVILAQVCFLLHLQISESFGWVNFAIKRSFLNQDINQCNQHILS